MLGLSHLHLFVFNGFAFLPECLHLVLLFLYQFCFSGNDLLVSLLQVAFLLLFFKVLGSDLHFMGLSVSGSLRKFKLTPSILQGWPGFF